MKSFFIYIITNYERTVLYIGITNNIQRRITEHKEGHIKGFSRKYNLKYLLHFEEYSSSIDAIKREKQLKSWNRKWKNELIEQQNPNWRDISE